MRTIKFRYKWDGKWYYIDFQNDNLREKFEEYENRKTTHLEQFTGLLDKNGTEIYDGDICQAEKANSYLKGKYQVVWDYDKGRWCYDGSSLIRKYQVGSGGNLKCEVIGNIHDQ